MKFFSFTVKLILQVSHPAWGGWIEMKSVVEMPGQIKSHPAWGGWIEIIRILLTVRII